MTKPANTKTISDLKTTLAVLGASIGVAMAPVADAANKPASSSGQKKAAAPASQQKQAPGGSSQLKAKSAGAGQQKLAPGGASQVKNK